MQRFLSDGTRIPVTEVKTSGNRVMLVQPSEGYISVQLGFGNRKKNSKTPAFLKETHLKIQKEEEAPKVGDILKTTDILKPGDIVDVIGLSKGKGFAGGVKRHHFKGGPRTHGQSDRERAPGSIGQTTTPGRVYKGKRMAGRMGHQRVTVKNLQVVDVSEEYLLIKGLVPGSVNSFVVVKKVGQDKKFIPLYQEEKPAQEVKEEEKNAS